jgi:hypothetical protein
MASRYWIEVNGADIDVNVRDTTRHWNCDEHGEHHSEQCEECGEDIAAHGWLHGREYVQCERCGTRYQLRTEVK